MLNNTTKQTVLAWFTGRARNNAETALHLLSESIKNGSWLPKAR